MKPNGIARHLLLSSCVLVLSCLGPSALGAVPGPAGSPTADPRLPGAAFLGPFHMVVLHLPIGLFSFAALLELIAWLRPFEGLRRVLGTTLGLGAAMSVLAAVLGLYRSSGGDYAVDILVAHRNTGIALTVVAALTALLHGALLKSGGDWLWWYRVSLGLTLALLLVASHHGGSLTHGQGFLTRNAPRPVRDWVDRWEGSGPSKVAETQSLGPESPVAGILEARCLACHGPEKQKGGFRVDRRESLLRGGESGVAAVVPGDPGRSALLRLILLPPGHDEVMPPSGKLALSDAEILAVLRWIRDGAP